MQGSRASGEVPVWDLLVRLFHWGLVLLIAITFVADEGAKWLHEPAGYAVLGLVAIRLAWGLIGPPTARFASFVRGPHEVGQYLERLRRGSAPRYLGHNPAGGVMIVLLLATISVVGITGWMSESDAWFGVEWVSALHSASANVLLVLIGAHVLGVVISSFAHHENLVRAMITGRKSAGLAADSALIGEEDIGAPTRDRVPRDAPIR